MNPWQMSQQIKHELERVIWPGGVVVFGTKGGVRVFADIPNEDQLPPIFPFAMVGLGSGVFDEDDPDLLVQTFTIMSAVMVRGDPMGEQAIIGGPAADLLSSKGRGSAEVTERARSAIKNLTGDDGARILVSTTTTSTPRLISGYQLVVEEFEVSVLCTSELEYTQPQEFAVAGSTWTWKGVQQCKSRYDFVQFRLGHVAGSAPTETPAGSTIVGTTTAETLTGVSQLAGKAYSIFADYSSRGQTGIVEGSSDGREVGAFLTT